MGWVRYNILRPSCNPADGRCWRVPLVECNAESMSPGSSGEGLQVLRGSRGPHHLREIRDEAGLVPAEKLRLGTDRALLKELQCLQNMVRTADRRSCLVRMGTAKQENIAWKLKKNMPVSQQWILQSDGLIQFTSPQHNHRKKFNITVQYARWHSNQSLFYNMFTRF